MATLDDVLAAIAMLRLEMHQLQSSLDNKVARLHEDTADFAEALERKIDALSLQIDSSSSAEGALCNTERGNRSLVLPSSLHRCSSDRDRQSSAESSQSCPQQLSSSSKVLYKLVSSRAESDDVEDQSLVLERLQRGAADESGGSTVPMSTSFSAESSGDVSPRFRPTHQEQAQRSQQVPAATAEASGSSAQVDKHTVLSDAAPANGYGPCNGSTATWSCSDANSGAADGVKAAALRTGAMADQQSCRSSSSSSGGNAAQPPAVSGVERSSGDCCADQRSSGSDPVKRANGSGEATGDGDQSRRGSDCSCGSAGFVVLSPPPRIMRLPGAAAAAAAEAAAAAAAAAASWNAAIAPEGTARLRQQQSAAFMVPACDNRLERGGGDGDATSAADGVAAAGGCRAVRAEAKGCGEMAAV